MDPFAPCLHQPYRKLHSPSGWPPTLFRQAVRPGCGLGCLRPVIFLQQAQIETFEQQQTKTSYGTMSVAYRDIHALENYSRCDNLAEEEIPHPGRVTQDKHVAAGPHTAALECWLCKQRDSNCCALRFRALTVLSKWAHHRKTVYTKNLSSTKLEGISSEPHVGRMPRSFFLKPNRQLKLCICLQYPAGNACSGCAACCCLGSLVLV